MSKVQFADSPDLKPSPAGTPTVEAPNATTEDDAILEAFVLVVDDEFVTRELLSSCLHHAGFKNVRVAADGQEALDIADQQVPDIIILDLEMPILNGFETCTALREREDTRDVPVLVQSATEKLSDVTAAFDVGANDILGKPMKAPELISRVRLHLEHRLMVKSLCAYKSRVAHELDEARAMQEFLCPAPSELHRISEEYGLSVGSLYRPSSEIGGDIWGIVEHDDRLNVFVADFAGHGVAAALNTFRLHTLIARLPRDIVEPGNIMSWLNRELCEILAPGQFSTMIWACMERGAPSLRYAIAGAPPPIFWPADEASKPMFVEGSGLPLGFLPEAGYAQHELAAGPGCRFLMFSDAAIEARDPDGEMLSEEGLFACADKHARLQDEQAFIDEIAHDLSNRRNLGIVDDLTLISLRVRT